MKEKDLKLNYYYLVKEFKAFYKGDRIGKLIALRDDKGGLNCLIEFIDDDVIGHTGSDKFYKIIKGKSSDKKKCWFIDAERIIKEMSFDEIMVYEL